MAGTTVVEFDKIARLFDDTDYAGYRKAALARKRRAQKLVDSLQV